MYQCDQLTFPPELIIHVLPQWNRSCYLAELILADIFGDREILQKKKSRNVNIKNDENWRQDKTHLCHMILKLLTSWQNRQTPGQMHVYLS